MHPKTAIEYNIRTLSCNSPRQRESEIMILQLIFLLCLSGQSLQEPIFKPSTMLTTSVFKGLPRLVDLNATAGETRMVYYHEQIVAVVDVLDGRKLLRCELIEV